MIEKRSEMKTIVSVSLGSSSRDHSVTAGFCGEDFNIRRIGTDGDVEKAKALIRELDGKVDVFGMGGISLYLYGSNNKKYVLKSALPLAQAAVKTPMVDGSGLKNTMERNVVQYMRDEVGVPLAGKKVFLVCAMDRFGMAEAFSEMGCEMIFGDMMFALGIPVPIRSLKSLHRLASFLMPIVSRLPLKALYPSGKNQDSIVPKFTRYYEEADIIAGDFLYIRKHLPDRLDGKIIVTNTVTAADVSLLKQRGAKLLLTSTPVLEGRSFGTNVMEAVVVSLLGKAPGEITQDEYRQILKEDAFRHRVEYF